MTFCAFFLHLLGREQVVKSFKSCYVDADDQLMHTNFPNGWEGANIFSVAQQHCNTSWQSLVLSQRTVQSLSVRKSSWKKNKSWYILHSKKLGAEV